MHRIQLYIDEDVFSQVKKASKLSNISISEFIRIAVKNELEKETRKNMADFFEQLKPLKSFHNVDAGIYTDNIRGKSRLIND